MIGASVFKTAKWPLGAYRGMGEKKTTLFEVNIENVNFEFSPDGGLEAFLSEGEENEEEPDEGESTLGLFGSEDEEETETEVEAEIEAEKETEEEEAEEESGSSIGLVIGLIFLVVVAIAAKKFVVDSEPEDYEEVELSDYES